MADQSEEYCSEIISCPYDERHKMRREKFIFHYPKCKTRTKVGHYYGHCKYNFLHIYLKPLLTQHEESCPDIKFLQKFQIIAKPEDLVKLPITTSILSRILELLSCKKKKKP